MLLPDTDLSGGLKVAEDVHRSFPRIKVDGIKQITGSVGVASGIPRLHQLPDLLVNAADEVIYSAKAVG